MFWNSAFLQSTCLFWDENGAGQVKRGNISFRVQGVALHYARLGFVAAKLGLASTYQIWLRCLLFVIRFTKDSWYFHVFGRGGGFLRQY